MYKVYGSPLNRTARVLWMLEELGQDYEIIPCGPHSEEIYRHNPLGKNPALGDGDVSVADSSAILHYLADKHGALTFPAGSPERAAQDRATFFLLDDIEGALWTDFKNRMVLPEDQRIPAILPQCEAQAMRAVAALEKLLGEGPYLMGATFTVPDIIAGHLANWMEYGCKYEIPAGKAKDYFDRVRARPALGAAMAKGKAAAKAAKDAAAG
ncbi:glutathione S-transferase family protein [Rhodovulum sp. DZ06]|uniref:glutathione S-transferase family protein n=1 Tax=Rhodovulum sp. DZ06 TaxID=3425126 RepID=UPI003D343D62